jgi:hypothetical protein
MQSSALVLPEPDPPTSVSLQKKGGSLGPLLLLVVLLGGGGALAYMMLNNADKTSSAQGGNETGSAEIGSAVTGSATTPTPSVGSAGRAPTTQVVQPVPAVGSDTQKLEGTLPNGSNGSAAIGQKPITTSKQHPGAATVRHPVVAVADDKVEPKAVILKQIQDAEAQGDWSQARIAYQKLGKVKGMQQQALYGEALAAFQMNDTTAAESISTKAGSMSGPFKLKALTLHADAIFKQGDAKRAKDNYISLRALAGDKEFKATVTKKIALCNNKLGLAERDGIIN